MPRPHRVSRWLYQRRPFARSYGRLAGRFAMDVLGDDLSRRFLARLPDEAVLLEIGAGPGLQAIELIARHPRLHVIASDFSEAMLELARQNLENAAGESEVIRRRADHLAFARVDAMDLSGLADRRIDGIYSMGAIKHFPDPLQCLREAAGVLSDGGTMYFADFCADGGPAGVQQVVDRLGVSPWLAGPMRFALRRGIEREAPGREEILSWVAAFRGDRPLEVEFSMAGSIFTLLYRKAKSADLTGIRSEGAPRGSG